jgi:NTP pyrophosphatase (non-canonical NTP hydrolase)
MQSNTISGLVTAAYENSKSKGFHEGEKNIGEMLCLIHSEVSEALEADRKGRYTIGDSAKRVNSYVIDSMFHADFEVEVKNTFEDELADIVIRVFDLAGSRGIDLESHIIAKMRYNSLRPYKHGKKY